MSLFFQPDLPERWTPRPPASILIIHDGVTAGLRAKRFIEQSSGAKCGGFEPEASLWMQESLSVAECAVAAWLNAEESDTVLISLGAGSELSDAAQMWIEAWLQYAGGERTRLVVLLEPSPDHIERAQALRSYFENVTSRHGVNLIFRSEASDAPAPCRAGAEALTTCRSPRTLQGRGLFTAAAAFAA